MRKLVLYLSTLLLSGSAYFYSADFHTIWWLMWLAPIPLLIYVRQVNWRLAASVAFLVGVSATLSGMVGYWGTSIPWTSNVVPGLISGLQFAMVFSITRLWQQRYSAWVSIFIFPILFSLSEWLLAFTSLGTYQTIAYNQLLFLPVTQIASVGGYVAITFTLSLFASAISYAVCHNQASKKQRVIGVTIGLAIVSLILIFGVLRCQQTENQATINIGLANKTNPIAYTLNPKNAVTIVKSYFPLFNKLANQGAKIIVIPEESFLVNTANQAQVIKILQDYARSRHVKLIVGVRQKLSKTYNTAWLFSADGKLIAQYRKRHFVPVVEDGITAGKKLVVFNDNQFKFAIAICRDLDYRHPASSYGQLGVNLLIAPAWDFSVDAWVHGRLAYMRAVEYGYTVVRAARNGYLSVTSKTGQFIAKTYAGSQSGTAFVVNTPIATGNSFYARHPYAFILCLLLLVAAIGGRMVTQNSKNADLDKVF